MLAVGAGWGSLDIFSHLSLLFPFSLCLEDGPILTEILAQRAVKPKTTNQASNRLPETGGMKREMIDERKKMSKQAHPHLLQAQ